MDNVLVQHIEKTPGVVGGKSRIAGTRIRVIDVVLWFEKRGKSADEIVDMFPGISLADVHAAMAYYYDHRAEIEQELADEPELVAKLRARFPSLLKEK